MTAAWLSGCASVGPAIELGATECDWARPILVSREDVLTMETARQILVHNEIWASICGEVAAVGQKTN